MWTSSIQQRALGRWRAHLLLRAPLRLRDGDEQLAAGGAMEMSEEVREALDLRARVAVSAYFDQAGIGVWLDLSLIHI